MKVSRSRGVAPGPYSFYNTPFLFDEMQMYFMSDEGDAKAYIVDHDPRLALNSGPVRMHTVRPFIVQWRVARDGLPGYLTLTHMAVNMGTQGLFLNARCEPANDAAFDNGRFFPFWRSVVEAINSAAIGQLFENPIEAGERLSEPLFALNEHTQARLRSERTRPGIVLLLLGVLMLLYTATRGVLAARRISRD